MGIKWRRKGTLNGEPLFPTTVGPDPDGGRHRTEPERPTPEVLQKTREALQNHLREDGVIVGEYVLDAIMNAIDPLLRTFTHQVHISPDEDKARTVSVDGSALTILARGDTLTLHFNTKVEEF